MFKVILTHPQDKADIEKKYLDEDMTLEIKHSPTEEDLINNLQDADAVISAYEPFTREVFEKLPNLKVISQAAIGYNSVDIEAAKELGIAVLNIPNYCTPEVADHTMALILNLNRRIMDFNKSVQVDKEWRYDLYTDIDRFGDLTLGLFGFGAIAREVSVRARGFGIRMLTCDPYIDKEITEEYGVELVNEDFLLKESDIISIHTPLTEETKGSFNLERYKEMKKKPYIINAGRGEIINQKDLVTALDEGLIKGAGLDVLDDESPDLDETNLLGRTNVILTPHIAYYSKKSQYEVQRLSAYNIVLYRNKEYDQISIVNDVKL